MEALLIQSHTLWDKNLQTSTPWRNKSYPKDKQNTSSFAADPFYICFKYCSMFLFYRLFLGSTLQYTSPELKKKMDMNCKT